MGKDHTNYYRVRFSAYAELDGEQVDITGFQCTYALDSIPSIEVWPTIGRDPSNDKEAEAVEKFLNAEQYTPLKVYAKFETELDSPEGESEPGFPYDEDVLIFDGYLLGTTYVTSRSPVGGTMQLTAHGAGWLVALAGTDSHTAGSTIKGPAGWDEIANPSSDGAGVGLFDIQSFIVVEKDAALVDLWQDYIKQVFFTIVSDKSVWGDTENTFARSALVKMDDDELFSNDASNKLVLQYGSGTIDQELLATFLAQAVGKVLFSRWRRGGVASIWDGIRECAGVFRFHIVPLIESAACCPVYGALAGDPYRTITTDDYSAINLTSQAAMMVTKYAVVGGQDTYSVTRSPTPRESGLIGFYSIDDKLPTDTAGQSIVTQAPLWLSAESEIGDISRESLGGENFGIPDAMNPDAFTGPPERDYQEEYNNIMRTDLGNNYAKTLMQEDNLKLRRGALGGRFRLDICPGSTVKFQVIDDKFADAEAEPKYMFGLVQSVTLRIESGRSGPLGSASTSFNLQYVRTEAEHEKDYITAQTHPLWSAGQKFLGTKLWKE